MAGAVITVSQLNLYIRSLIEGDPRLAAVRVSGEISNFKAHYSSGHLYFSLKDSGGAVRCVMFRSNAARLKTPLRDGMRVVLIGRVSVYERDGNYQIYVEDIVPDGEGDLMLALEKIKQKLEAEGLFDVKRKKRLPRFPKRVAVITSDTGAAVRDIFNVLSRRWPIADLLLCPALVQGAGAPASLISALDRAERDSNADVIIIGRGGGSIEDLWCFNDEALARRIAKCTIPIISAVGHETDFTVCDFVSDMRAPTPSAAAELAVPDIEEIRASVEGYRHLIRMRSESAVRLNSARLEKITESEKFKNPAEYLTEGRATRLEKTEQRFKTAFEKQLSIRERSFSLLAAKMDGMSPLKIMARGYLAATKRGKTVISTEDIEAGDIINLRLSDGRAECEVKEVERWIRK